MFTECYRKLTDPFKRSIRNKLILTMTLLAVLPVIAMTAMAAENTRSSMEEEIMETNRANMNWASIYLGEQFARMNNIIYSIQISDELHQYLALNQEAPAASRFDEQKAMFNMLNSVYYSAGNYVFGVELYLKELDTLFTFNSMDSRIKTVSEIPEGYHELFAQHKDFTIINDPDDPQKFHMTRSMNRFEDQAQIGAISLEVKWAEFNQTLELLDSRGIMQYTSPTVRATRSISRIKTSSRPLKHWNNWQAPKKVPVSSVQPRNTYSIIPSTRQDCV